MIPLAHDAPLLKQGMFRASQDRFGLSLGSCRSPAHPDIQGFKPRGSSKRSFMRRETAIQIVGHSNVTCEQSNPSSDRPVSTWSSMRANEYLHLPDSLSAFRRGKDRFLSLKA